jgi:hypothetical protein
VKTILRGRGFQDVKDIKKSVPTALNAISVDVLSDM